MSLVYEIWDCSCVIIKGVLELLLYYQYTNSETIVVLLVCEL